MKMLQKSMIRINELIFVGKLARELEQKLPLVLFGANLDVKKIFRGQTSVLKANNTILDVGCDHGWIGVTAIEKGLGDKVIFSDVSQFSLNKAIDLARVRNIADKSAFRCGNGLDVVGKSEKIGIAFLAGMGGHLISSILQNVEKAGKVDWFILQTATDDRAIRLCLKNLGYYILYDKMVFERGKTYHTFLATKLALVTLQTLSECDRITLEFMQEHGKAYKNVSDDFMKEYLEFENENYGKQNFFATGKNHFNMLCWHVDKQNEKLSMVDFEMNKSRDLNPSIIEYKNDIMGKLKVLRRFTQSIRESE